MLNAVFESNFQKIEKAKAAVGKKVKIDKIEIFAQFLKILKN